jgi:hypothetical protein
MALLVNWYRYIRGIRWVVWGRSRQDVNGLLILNWSVLMVGLSSLLVCRQAWAFCRPS